MSAWIESARTPAIECVVHPRGIADGDHELRFPAGPLLTVVVVDATSGEAVHWATVNVEGNGVLMPHTSTNAQGLTRFGPLKPGKYTITIPRLPQLSVVTSRVTSLVVTGKADIEITVTGG